MTPPTLVQHRPRDGAILLSFGVEQYHRMLEVGILDEGAPFELLEGMIVLKDRSAVGAKPWSYSPRQAWAIQTLARLDAQLAPMGVHLWTQRPITLPPNSEPEPDGAIIRGDEDDYLDRHPGADDVCCVIEVADASLRYDRGFKSRIYARAGIAQYVIINLIDCVVEEYTRPLAKRRRYADSRILDGDDDQILLRAGEQTLAVPVDELLP